MNGFNVRVTPSLLALCALFVVQAEVSGQGPQTPTSPQALHPAFADVNDDPALPRVLLIGDSISIGYTLPTRRSLQGKANVHRIPVNGGPTIDGLEQLDRWIGSGKWDVIHFNWGLHDLKFMDDGQHQVAIDKYEAHLRDLVGRLKRTGAALIWASTTPVPDEEVSPPRQEQRRHRLQRRGEAGHGGTRHSDQRSLCVGVPTARRDPAPRQCALHRPRL